MRKLIYISIWLSCITGTANAQEKFVYEDSSLLQTEEITPPVEEVQISEEVLQSVVEERTDTSLYPNNISLSPDSIQQWKKLKEYAYITYLDSLLKQRKQEEVKQQKPREPGKLNDFLGSGFFSGLLWVLAIGFVGFLVYRLFLADAVFRRSPKAISSESTETVEEEFTSESDFDAFIRTALQHGNFRQAVRYQYLRTLHALADKGLVELAPDKTNYQYVSELRNHDLQQPFSALTLNYEYVWYGEFNIDREIYQKIEPGFTGFNQKLQTIS
jgi:Domain of unknown function (DUF4129)